MSRVSRLSALCALALVVGCTPEEESKPTPPTVTASVDSVVADGVSTLVFSVSGTEGQGVRLKATQGTWVDTGTDTLRATGDVSANLRTCDSRTVSLCGGNMQVTATKDDGAAAFALVTFVALENCASGRDDDGDGAADCADSDCLGSTCALPAGAVGTGVCAPNGTCVCDAGAVEVCTDGVDNNCDGKADCLDPTCASKTCTLGTGFTGVCKNNACSCPATTEVSCSNGLDDDCDGLTDCAERDCQGVGGGIGKVCDSTGHACTSPVNGVSTCTACSGNGGVAQPAETYCLDRKDNDCDGLVDCEDPDCEAAYCDVTGKICNTATATCACPGDATEIECSDGRDNDCDGTTDCKDLDCQPTVSGTLGKVCGANGMLCTATGTCICSGNDGKSETAEATCGDGHDNDCDGYVDCLDVQCRPTTPSGVGKDCSQPTGTPPTLGMSCNAVGQCICPAGQTAEVTCADQVDNDCDGQIDCADPECALLACAPFGKACTSGTSSTCACPAGTIETCTDFVDNDCDGLVDCADSDCGVGVQCNAASSNYKCEIKGTTRLCVDTSSTVFLQLVASPSRIAADGLATSTVTATLKDGTVAQGGKTLDFAVGATSSGTLNPTSAITNATGQASTVYTSSSVGGVHTVTASYFTGTQTIVGSVAIETPMVGQVKFVSQQYSLLGVRYSSYQETSEIKFQVLDTNGQPYPPGLAVSFTHAPVGGSYIGSAPNCTTTVCTASAVTNATGEAKVTLHSGTLASVVSVTASASGGGGSGTATASNIAIVGAKASGSNISITCTPRNVGAFNSNDCTNSQINATVNCTAAFGDRFQNVLGVPTQATFSSEAGLAGPPQFTDKGGLAKGTISVFGAKLPVDVTPFSGEWSLSYDSGCGTKTHNPRDGLVSVIVTANGEEGFVDGSNGQPANGVYDSGENYIDLAEPFIDANDNGTCDANETCFDTNNNGSWDGPNGQWDSNKVLWSETRILYTGFGKIAYTQAGEYTHSRWYVGTAPPTLGATLAASFSVTTSTGAAPTANVGVYFTDQNFNQLQAGTTYALTTVTGGISATFTQTPAVVDNLGMSFTQQYCDTSGAGCSNICQYAPCRVFTSVNAFSYGNYGAVTIKGGGQTASYAEARVSATFSGVTVPMSISGSVQ